MSKARAMAPAPLSLWGGIECTVNRVEDRYFDQLVFTGHDHRPEDLRRFAELGITTLRYPVLWERVLRHRPLQPKEIADADWAWVDERLALLRALGIHPIVGFVHHGSGPPFTHLLDPGFALGLAQFAAAFARRYPWVSDYTPVNEPLTTARFSGLYGLWYPHDRSDASFARMLLTQCQAIALAMRAIRLVNPQARLIQTEDLGQSFSTPLLAYQAEFDNHRRWLSLDLLCGCVNADHPLWRYLIERGQLNAAELLAFQDPSPPDVIGINYYVTSDRFLDHRLDRYAPHLQGGNGRHRYADSAAVRVRKKGITGHRALLSQAWERYALPLAFTEVHLGCTREEQLRWLKEAWEAAEEARKAGIDVRAVTAWALLGSSNWNTLVTREEGYYESGAFDARARVPRLTAIGRQIKELCAGRTYTHPALAGLGWWRRDTRLEPPVTAKTPHAAWKPGKKGKSARRPILIAGGTGTLGKAFGRACQDRGLHYCLLGRAQMDIADPSAVKQSLTSFAPWAVVNAAGYVRVDQAEQEPEACRRENTIGPEVLAALCQELGLSLVTFSSDLVFDGVSKQPYAESDLVAPLSVYGASKAEAERRVLLQCPSALVVRTSSFFGPWDEFNFVTQALRTLKAGRPLRAPADLVVSPTYVPELVHAVLDLLIDGESGLWHLVNDGAVSFAELAAHAAELAGYNPRLVEGCAATSLGLLARRPPYAALRSERGSFLPKLSLSLLRYVRESAPLWQGA